MTGGWGTGAVRAGHTVGALGPSFRDRTLASEPGAQGAPSGKPPSSSSLGQDGVCPRGLCRTPSTLSPQHRAEHTACARVTGAPAQVPAGGFPGRHRDPGGTETCSSPGSSLGCVHQRTPPHAYCWPVWAPPTAPPSPLALGSCHGIVPAHHPLRPPGRPRLTAPTPCCGCPVLTVLPTARALAPPAPPPAILPLLQPHSCQAAARLLQRACLDCPSQSALAPGAGDTGPPRPIRISD